MTARPDPRRGERGTALVLTVVMGFLVMAIWASAWRSTHDTIRAEAYVLDRQARSDEVLRGAADAVDLLRTGTPPSDPYECTFRYTPSGGGTRVFIAVTYTETGSDVWDVAARYATLNEAQTWPKAPASF